MFYALIYYYEDYGLRGVVDQSDGSVDGFETVNIDYYPAGSLGFQSGGDVFFIVDRENFMNNADVVFWDDSGSGSGNYPPYTDHFDAFIAEGNDNSDDDISNDGLDFQDSAGDHLHVDWGVDNYGVYIGSNSGPFGEDNIPVVIAVDGLSGDDTVTASACQ